MSKQFAVLQLKIGTTFYLYVLRSYKFNPKQIPNLAQVSKKMLKSTYFRLESTPFYKLNNEGYNGKNYSTLIPI